MNDNLEFRKIPSLKFLYEVNSDGTIFRNARSKRVLKCRKHSHNSQNEYWCLNVNIAKKIRKVYIHKVVAECWLGAKPEGYEVDHIDRNSLNNNWTNLRYVTRSEQMKNRDYSGAFWDTLINNLAKGNKGHVRPVRLIRDGEYIDFPTARQAAKYLAMVYSDKKVKSFSDKFYLHRRRIFDYDVIYLNAETGHGNQEKGKEQSDKYLVGTIERWNDSKQAEERDRVKHEPRI